MSHVPMQLNSRHYYAYPKEIRVSLLFFITFAGVHSGSRQVIFTVYTDGSVCTTCKTIASNCSAESWPRLIGPWLESVITIFKDTDDLFSRTHGKAALSVSAGIVEAPGSSTLSPACNNTILAKPKKIAGSDFTLRSFVQDFLHASSMPDHVETESGAFKRVIPAIGQPF